MRCLNCQVSNKRPRAKSWVKWCLCGECAKRKHPLEYGCNNKDRRVLVKKLYNAKLRRTTLMRRLTEVDAKIILMEKQYKKYLEYVKAIV